MTCSVILGCSSPGNSCNVCTGRRFGPRGIDAETMSMILFTYPPPPINDLDERDSRLTTVLYAIVDTYTITADCRLQPNRHRACQGNPKYVCTPTKCRQSPDDWQRWDKPDQHSTQKARLVSCDQSVYETNRRQTKGMVILLSVGHGYNTRRGDYNHKILQRIGSKTFRSTRGANTYLSSLGAVPDF
jgi:hypothetical protein